MSVVVVEPPEPIVTPEDVGGNAGDQMLMALIQAATEEIDGPTGWVGRCFGPQTLELTLNCGLTHSTSLPCPPIIGILSVAYTDANGEDHPLPEADYGLVSNALTMRWGSGIPTLIDSWEYSSPLKIRYRAGYDGETTGPVPERARQAVILAVRNMQALSAENLFLRSEEVEGIGTMSYTVSDIAGRVMRETSERLLQGLRVYA